MSPGYLTYAFMKENHVGKKNTHVDRELINTDYGIML